MAIATQQLQGTYVLDPIHSSASFAVKHMVVSTFRGRFERFDATLTDGKLVGTVDVGSIVVKDENLAAHLQSPDFLDGERAPEITFESTAVRRTGERVEIDGELTIKGVTLPVRAEGTVTEPADDPYGGVRFALKLATAVDRTKYGITWNNPLPNGKPSLADQVRISADLYLVKA
jgi:polyisoprenoid-binding protein YceI